ARGVRERERAGHVAQAEADAGTAQGEIGFQPWDSVEQRAKLPDVLEVACGPGVVSTPLSHQRSCRVGDGALGDVAEVLFLDQLKRFDGPSGRVSGIVDLGR